MPLPERSDFAFARGGIVKMEPLDSCGSPITFATRRVAGAGSSNQSNLEINSNLEIDAKTAVLRGSGIVRRFH
jgi:hypothetical protein